LPDRRRAEEQERYAKYKADKEFQQTRNARYQYAAPMLTDAELRKRKIEEEYKRREKDIEKEIWAKWTSTKRTVNNPNEYAKFFAEQVAAAKVQIGKGFDVKYTNTLSTVHNALSRVQALLEEYKARQEAIQE